MTYTKEPISFLNLKVQENHNSTVKLAINKKNKAKRDKWSIVSVQEHHNSYAFKQGESHPDFQRKTHFDP